MNEASVRREAARVLRSGWREGTRPDGTRYAFTCPAPRKYIHQWRASAIRTGTG